MNEARRRLIAARGMPSSQGFQKWMLEHYHTTVREHLQGRGNLSREDLVYVAEKVMTMKDERLAHAVTTLMGWGDEERAELETFCAVALEVMRLTPPSRLREAARNVELRFLMKDLK